MNIQNLKGPVLSLLLLIALEAPAWGQPQEVSMTIAADAAGNCVVTEAPADIVGAKRAQVVRWHVRNDCSGSRTVTFENFRLESAGDTSNSPVNFRPAGPIPPGESRIEQGVIRSDLPDNRLGTYKYDIYIDGAQALDPRLEIDG